MEQNYTGVSISALYSTHTFNPWARSRVWYDGMHILFPKTQVKAYNLLWEEGVGRTFLFRRVAIWWSWNRPIVVVSPPPPPTTFHFYFSTHVVFERIDPHLTHNIPSCSQLGILFFLFISDFFLMLLFSFSLSRFIFPFRLSGKSGTGMVCVWVCIVKKDGSFFCCFVL